LVRAGLAADALWSTAILRRCNGRFRPGLNLFSRAAPGPCSAARSGPLPTDRGSLTGLKQRTLPFFADFLLL